MAKKKKSAKRGIGKARKKAARGRKASRKARPAAKKGVKKVSKATARKAKARRPAPSTAAAPLPAVQEVNPVAPAPVPDVDAI
jgi:hypothetical protein